MPFDDNEFDIVLSFGVMHHISNWEKALEEISRVIKPQGFLIFGDLAYSRFTTKIFRPVVKNYGLYTIDDIAHRLERNGFEIVHEEGPKGRIMKYYSLVFRKA
jgi:ubiquinone/menaquinone biosynthesis C-methylase UbiE